MDFILIDLISLFETTTKGNQYALTVIYMLTNYLTCIPTPDKSTDTWMNSYLKKYIVDLEEVERFCQIMEVNSKIHYFQKNLSSQESNPLSHLHTRPKPLDA